MDIPLIIGIGMRVWGCRQLLEPKEATPRS